MNPLLAPWPHAFDMPPFDTLKDPDFAPAFEAEMAALRSVVAEITDNPEAPSFANTIEAYEAAGAGLGRVARVFFTLAGADTNPAREALQTDLSPKLAALQSEISTNPALFARVDAVYQQRQSLGLTDEQIRVLELMRRDFVRAGALLDPVGKARLSEIMQRLAALGTAFAQNVLADEKDWSLKLSADDLEGLPDFLLDAARAAAEARGETGHVITLARSLITPFLEFSTRRDLREIAFRAWAARGANGGPTDNAEIVTETLALRQERAELLGHADFATYKLAPQMAGTPARVREMLDAVWTPARSSAQRDAEKLTALMQRDGINDSLRPWDWRHYATILQRETLQIDVAEVKPYFQLEKMIEAAFYCANRLFGLTFEPLDVPLYHADARAWAVARDGAHVGVFVGDYFARSSKRSGAWCGSLRNQAAFPAIKKPITTNVCNFAKPPAGSPALLTFDDARTLFHEFGHGLHNLLSDVTYESVSGTSVARDFVELPSQLFEHWLTTPEILGRFATHAETGQPMPQDLMDRLIAAENFDQGFASVEYTASALVDLEFHTGPAPADPMARQKEILDDLGMPEAIVMRHATPHFQHVFAGDGYSAGYYSYMWSEMMDADAFAAFREAGDIFDAETAKRLETHIYSAGGTRPADALYTAFRGKMPGVEALLTQRGLTAA